MNILLIKHFFVGFMVSEIPTLSVFGHFPYSVTFPYIYIYIYAQTTSGTNYIHHVKTSIYLLLSSN